MRIFGPLVWSTTLPVTETLASAAASVVSSVPSTTSSAGKVSSVPGSPSSFSTSTTSPTATLYCLPPVFTIAYIVDATLLLLDGVWSRRPAAQNSAHRFGGPRYRLRAARNGGQTGVDRQ